MLKFGFVDGFPAMVFLAPSRGWIAVAPHPGGVLVLDARSPGARAADVQRMQRAVAALF